MQQKAETLDLAGKQMQNRGDLVANFGKHALEKLYNEFT